MRYIYSLSLCLFQMVYIIAALDENTLREFLKEVNSEMAEIQEKISRAQLDFEINKTKSTEEKLVQVYKEAAESKKKYQEFNAHDCKISDADLQEQLKKFSNFGYESLPMEEFLRLKRLELEVGNIEKETTICEYNQTSKCDLRIKEVKEKMLYSRDPEERKYIWTEWRKIVGYRSKDLFDEFVKLTNHEAILNNFTNFEEYLLKDFKMTKVKEEMLSLWEKIKPLYLDLHAYVRRKLSNVYGEEFISKTGTIPAYFLGDLWSEDWHGIADLVMPYAYQDRFNLSRLIISKGFDASKIHQLSEQFFSPLNFSPLPNDIWLNTTDLTDCDSKVFDLGNSIRIIHCGHPSEENVLKAHSLVATAQYIQQYKQQPPVFRDFVGSGLRDAINDMTELSFSSFQHLKKLNLYEGEKNYELHINRLMETALQKIPAIASALVKELWRWGVFAGEIREDQYNCQLEELKESHQGISSYTRDLNFDPGGLAGVFSPVSFVHIFVRYIGQFQILDSLCHSSGFDFEENHLDDCDICQSEKAGSILRKAMSLGSSKPLTDVLQILTGETVLSVDALLEYFEPLRRWLEEENHRSNEYIGWESEGHEACPKKHRRKRSLEYLSDSPDSPQIQSLEPERYQPLERRSRRGNPSEDSSPEKDQSNLKDENQKTALTNDDKSFKEDKNEKAHQKAVRRSVNYKRARSSNNQRSNEDRQSNKFKSSWYGKSARDSDGYETNDKEYSKKYVRRIRKRGETKDDEKKENDNVPSKSSEENKVRSARRAYQKMRSDAYDDSLHHKIRQRKNVQDYQNEKESREQKVHTNTKKDISRLLHSFGFSVENDEKEKVKELKKKTDNEEEGEYEEDKSKIAYSPESAVASWASQDMKKKNYFVKKQKYNNVNDNNRLINTLLNDGRSYQDNEGSSSYESVIDINRLKGEDKNRLWSLNDLLENSQKAYLANKNGANKLNGDFLLQNGKVVGKKDILSAMQQAAMKSRSDDAESYGNTNMDLSSLQNLLKTVNMNSWAQNPNSEVKYKSNPFFGTKPDAFKNFRFTGDDGSAFKDRKEFREEDGTKSPFIIIVGQITPEMKEKLMQSRGNLQPFFQSFANGDKSATWEDVHSGKSNGKREGNEKVYIVPINVKSNQNIAKANKITEHEHETGHDQDTERDRETEERYNWAENTKLNDKNSLRRDKEYPSEVYVSWEGLDKNKRIARRTKREHKKFKENAENNNKMNSMRLVPMKESMLEKLLGNNADHLNLDDKNLRMLANGLSNLEGNQGQSPYASNFASKSQGNRNSWMQGSEEMDESKLDSNNEASLANKELKDKDLTIDLTNPTLRCNTCGKKNKSDDNKQECCKSVFVLSCPPKCPCPPPCGPCCPSPCPCPCPYPPPCPKPCPCPCPPPCGPCGPCGPVPCPLPWPIPCPTCPSDKCDPICCEPKDVCSKKPSECSMVNAQFKITKAKKPHERLTIMIYDRINPPEELPEPYDALAVISEVLQKIQCQTCKPPCPQLTEEDPDYPANDNTDQLKGQGDASKNKNQDMNEENPNLENPEEEESDDNPRNSAEDEKPQSKDKATPALDQLTVFNKDKLAPVLLELRKIDDLIKKRNP